jgi:hypothetical protein
MLRAENPKKRHEKQETNPQCRIQGLNGLGCGEGPQDGTADCCGKRGAPHVGDSVEEPDGRGRFRGF